MPRITTYDFHCDLCGTKVAGCKLDVPPRWIHFSQEDAMEERRFHERYVCRYCVNEIVRELEKEKQQ